MEDSPSIIAVSYSLQYKKGTMKLELISQMLVVAMAKEQPKGLESQGHDIVAEISYL
jgi:hypothetical protein